MEWIYLIIAIVGAIISSIWLIIHYIEGDLPNVSISNDDIRNTFINLFHTFHDD